MPAASARVSRPSPSRSWILRASGTETITPAVSSGMSFSGSPVCPASRCSATPPVETAVISTCAVGTASACGMRITRTASGV